MLLYRAETSNSLIALDVYRWEILSKAIHGLAWVFQRGLSEQKGLDLIFLKIYKCLNIQVHTKRDFYVCQRITE